MGIFNRFAATLWGRTKAESSPVEEKSPVVRERPLYEQFTRIGGNLTPATVSYILAAADAGQPSQLLDLFNESRQKDGHLQSVCYTRETAVGLLPWDFIGPDEAERTPEEQKALELCKRVRDEFENWPTLLDTLTSAFVPGHATCEIKWKRTNDGLLLPYRAEPIHPREFIFSATDGKLRYAGRQGDQVGVDLLEEFPGRVVQIQRRIVGDVQVREGLIRIFIWAALFRNWNIKDWLALGEVGWKPWRIGTYKKGASKEDRDALVAILEGIGSRGIGIKPETVDLVIEWPKGTTSSSNTSSHREFYDAIGREISKAGLGQTTSIEAGPNGDRAATQTRDEIRSDIREGDAVHAAACLRYQLFSYVIAINLGDNVRVPVPFAVTDETIDQLNFATAINRLAAVGTKFPQRWVRDQIGSPDPKKDEETIGNVPQAPAETGKPSED